MNTPAERLTELWRQSRALPNRVREVDIELLHLMDAELDKGRLTSPLLVACRKVENSLDLWHLGREMASVEGWDEGDSPWKARLVFLPAIGYLKDLEAWAAARHLETGVRAGVAMRCDGMETGGQEIQTQCLSIPVHPAALATASPDEVRSLLTLVRKATPSSMMEGHPIIQRHRALEAADPLQGTTMRVAGARVCVATISAPQYMAHESPAGGQGVFDRVLEDQPAAVAEWHDIMAEHGGMDDNAMEVMSPVRLSESLLDSLHHHIIQAWANDLEDRGGRDDEGHFLVYPDDAIGFITGVDFVPSGHDTTLVQAQSTLGTLVPVEIPLAWAQAGGPGSLEECVMALLDDADGDPTEEPDETRKAALFSEPRKPRMLH